MIRLLPCYNGTSSRYSSMEDDITAAQSAGYLGLELKRWKLDDYLQRGSVGDLTRILADSGIAPPTLGPYTMVAFGDDEQRRLSLEKVRRHAEIAAALGVQGIVMYFDEPRKPTGAIQPRNAFELLQQTATEYADLLKEFGLFLGLESLGGQEIFRGPVEAMEIARAVRWSNVRFVFDTFHMYRNQVPISSTFGIPQEFVLIIHVSDCEPLPLPELEDKHRLYPGLGVIPLVKMLQPIIARGYRRFISLEVPRPEYWSLPVAEVCSAGVGHLRSLMAQLEQGDQS